MALDERVKKSHPILIRYTGTNIVEWTFKAENVVNGLMSGKMNNTGTVTLMENSATTVVSIAYGRLGIDTVILFSPTTANAATEFGAGSMYVSARSVSTDPNTASTFTITHVNNAQTDRTFSFVLIG